MCLIEPYKSQTFKYMPIKLQLNLRENLISEMLLHAALELLK
jgi:hypothetical protein